VIVPNINSTNYPWTYLRDQIFRAMMSIENAAIGADMASFKLSVQQDAYNPESLEIRAEIDTKEDVD
jgi:hypothetical protein